ncbi:hypothetical protein AKO1_001429, partial [Acrasis kona]
MVTSEPASRNVQPPVHLMDEKKQAIFEEFKKQVFALDLNEKQKNWCDDKCLKRYLRARDFDIKKSLNMIKNTIQWRATYKPDEITPESISKAAAGGSLYQRGIDKFGRPMMFVTPALDKHSQADPETSIKMLVYFLEKVIALMDENVETQVWVLDFKDYQAKNMPPISMSKHMIEILSNHYPERM